MGLISFEHSLQGQTCTAATTATQDVRTDPNGRKYQLTIDEKHEGWFFPLFYYDRTEGQGGRYLSRTEAWLPADAAVPQLAGDLSGNGRLDMTDALFALRFAAGILRPTQQQVMIGDVAPLVNGRSQPDGKIDIGDAVVLLRRSVGLSDQ